ncbi:MAG: hypothetical protein AAF242_19620, partial [Bacteroidota bacterium]
FIVPFSVWISAFFIDQIWFSNNTILKSRKGRFYFELMSANCRSQQWRKITGLEKQPFVLGSLLI